MTDLYSTECGRCGRPVMTSPRSTIVALCIECRYDVTGAHTNYDPTGKWHPNVGYPSPGLDPRTAEAIERANLAIERLHPAPVQTSAAGAIPIAAPAPVQALKAFAETFGWQTWLTYARGHGIHGSTGKPTSEVHSLALRLKFPGARACAVYVSPVAKTAWSWKSLWVWGPATMFLPVGMADFKTFVHAGGKTGPMWVDHVKACHEESERQAAAKKSAVVPKRAIKEHG